MRLQWLVPGSHRKYPWVMEKVLKNARFRREQPFRWAVVSHSMLFWNTWLKRATQVSYHCHLPDVSSLHIFRRISLFVWGLLDILVDRLHVLSGYVYCSVNHSAWTCGLPVSTTVRYMPKYLVLFCAVRAFRVFIKHRGFVQSAYL